MICKIYRLNFYIRVCSACFPGQFYSVHLMVRSLLYFEFSFFTCVKSKQFTFFFLLGTVQFPSRIFLKRLSSSCYESCPTGHILIGHTCVGFFCLYPSCLIAVVSAIKLWPDSFVISLIVACQTLLFLGFSRQNESEWSFLSSGDLLMQGSMLVSSAPGR